MKNIKCQRSDIRCQMSDIEWSISDAYFEFYQMFLKFRNLRIGNKKRLGACFANVPWFSISLETFDNTMHNMYYFFDIKNHIGWVCLVKYVENIARKSGTSRMTCTQKNIFVGSFFYFKMSYIFGKIQNKTNWLFTKIPNFPIRKVGFQPASQQMWGREAGGKWRAPP